MAWRGVGLVLVLAAFPLCVGAYGCSSSASIRVATTTSVENSGLLAAILPAFERDHQVRIDVLPVGSGRALSLLKRGDVDAGLTHDPKAEAFALQAGIITSYRKIMFNDFIIVGPPGDPAAVAQASGIVDALHRIEATAALFVSRGDASGTYSREQELWALANRRPVQGRLLETGQGMAATLRVASERSAYTLTDRATFERVRSRLRLKSVSAGGPELLNTYAIFQRVGLTGADRAAATALTDWLAEGEGRQLIAGFPCQRSVSIPSVARRNSPRPTSRSTSCSLRSGERCC